MLKERDCKVEKQAKDIEDQISEHVQLMKDELDEFLLSFKNDLNVKKDEIIEYLFFYEDKVNTNKLIYLFAFRTQNNEFANKFDHELYLKELERDCQKYINLNIYVYTLVI